MIVTCQFAVSVFATILSERSSVVTVRRRSADLSIDRSSVLCVTLAGQDRFGSIAAGLRLCPVPRNIFIIPNMPEGGIIFVGRRSECRIFYFLEQEYVGRAGGHISPVGAVFHVITGVTVRRVDAVVVNYPSGAASTGKHHLITIADNIRTAAVEQDASVAFLCRPNIRREVSERTLVYKHGALSIDRSAQEIDAALADRCSTCCLQRAEGSIVYTCPLSDNQVFLAGRDRIGQDIDCTGLVGNNRLLVFQRLGLGREYIVCKLGCKSNRLACIAGCIYCFSGSTHHFRENMVFIMCANRLRDDHVAGPGISRCAPFVSGCRITGNFFSLSFKSLIVKSCVEDGVTGFHTGWVGHNARASHRFSLNMLRIPATDTRCGNSRVICCPFIGCSTPVMIKRRNIYLLDLRLEICVGKRRRIGRFALVHAGRLLCLFAGGIDCFSLGSLASCANAGRRAGAVIFGPGIRCLTPSMLDIYLGFAVVVQPDRITVITGEVSETALAFQSSCKRIRCVTSYIDRIQCAFIVQHHAD